MRECVWAGGLRRARCTLRLWTTSSQGAAALCPSHNIVPLMPALQVAAPLCPWPVARLVLSFNDTSPLCWLCPRLFLPSASDHPARTLVQHRPTLIFILKSSVLAFSTPLGRKLFLRLQDFTTVNLTQILSKYFYGSYLHISSLSISSSWSNLGS